VEATGRLHERVSRLVLTTAGDSIPQITLFCQITVDVLFVFFQQQLSLHKIRKELIGIPGAARYSTIAAVLYATGSSCIPMNPLIQPTSEEWLHSRHEYTEHP